MNVESDEFYEAFFERELAALSLERGSLERLEWLADHLEEYVGRWLGFCAVTSEPELAVAGAPGFKMVQRGATALGKELAAGEHSRRLNKSWQAFLASLQQVENGGKSNDAARLESATHNLRGSISALRS